MNDQNSTGSQEVQQLIETNEALLKSKGRLQQEIIELKKKIEDQGKNIKLIGALQEKVAALNTELSNQTLNYAIVSSEKEDLKNQVAALGKLVKSLQTEIDRLENLSWFKKLLGKR
jgi:uncharacterized protein YeeX (DUF496 family)